MRLEPFQNWIKVASNLVKIARDNLFAKKVACRTLFGSNLVLAGGQVRAEGAESGANAPQNHGRHKVPPMNWPSKSRLVLSWCPGWGSNPHAFRHRGLNSACMPISPPGLIFSIFLYQLVHDVWAEDYGSWDREFAGSLCGYHADYRLYGQVIGVGSRLWFFPPIRNFRIVVILNQQQRVFFLV